MRTEFKEKQNELAYPTGVEKHWWTLARNKYLIKKIQSSTNFSDKYFLDIGCGRGFFVDILNRIGIECEGVELSEIEFVKGDFSSKMRNCNVFDLPLSVRKKINCILLLDVLEHIEKPHLFLEQINEAFMNLTDVFITLPARNDVWSRYDEFYGHFTRYDFKLLKNLNSNIPYDVARKSYFFHSIYLIAKIMKFFGIKRSIKWASPRNRREYFWHRIVSHLIDGENTIVPFFIPGLSLFCHLTKKS